MKRFISVLLALIVCFSVCAQGNSEETAILPQQASSAESGVSENPGSRSAVNSGVVPVITLSNGVQVPQMGLGTQIQSLERDSSETVLDGYRFNRSTDNDVIAWLNRIGISI